MDSNDDYRKQAAEAQAWADRTLSDVDRASWLRIAQSWLALIRKPTPTAEQALDDNAEARGTAQDKSDKSH